MPEDTPVSTLPTPNPGINMSQLRLEEIPPDQLDLGGDAILVPVAHFQKEVFTNFGTPFFIKVVNVRIFSFMFQPLSMVPMALLSHTQILER